MSISCTFSENLIARYWSKIADFNSPTLYSAPRLRVMPLKFYWDLYRQKSRVTKLSYEVLRVIVGLAIRFGTARIVTDEQTNGRTDTRPRHILTHLLISRVGGSLMRLACLRAYEACEITVVRRCQNVIRWQQQPLSSLSNNILTYPVTFDVIRRYVLHANHYFTNCLFRINRTRCWRSLALHEATVGETAAFIAVSHNL